MGRSRVNQIRRHFETNEPGNGAESREKKRRERDGKRAIPPSCTRNSSYPLSSSLFLFLASLPTSSASSEIFKAFPSYFPLFLLFILLFRSPVPILVYILSFTASWIDLLSQPVYLHPFQNLQTITHSCDRGTVINHLLDAAETMVLRPFTCALSPFIRTIVGTA